VNTSSSQSFSLLMTLKTPKRRAEACMSQSTRVKLSTVKGFSDIQVKTFPDAFVALH
jgi:hypothetical protein